MSELRAAIAYCPFCAEETLHPAEPGSLPVSAAANPVRHGGWECRSCLRVFAVRLLGLATAGRTT